MAPFKTRLDAVLRLNEQKEEEALLKLAHSQRATQLAQATADAAVEKSRRDFRQKGDAAGWAMEEAANVVARKQVKTAQEQVVRCTQETNLAQQIHLNAHQRSSAVRRAADSRRDVMKQEADRLERRNTDELAIMGFTHRSPK